MWQLSRLQLNWHSNGRWSSSNLRAFSPSLVGQTRSQYELIMILDYNILTFLTMLTEVVSARTVAPVATAFHSSQSFILLRIFRIISDWNVNRKQQSEMRGRDWICWNCNKLLDVKNGGAGLYPPAASSIHWPPLAQVWGRQGLERREASHSSRNWNWNCLSQARPHSQTGPRWESLMLHPSDGWSQLRPTPTTIERGKMRIWTNVLLKDRVELCWNSHYYYLYR